LFAGKATEREKEKDCSLLERKVANKYSN